MRYPRRSPLCEAAGADRCRAAAAAAPAGAASGPSACARTPSAAARAAAPAASGCLARRATGSLPYRQRQQECDEGDEDEAEIAADGQELEPVEILGDAADRGRGRCIEHLPREVVHRLG